MKCPLDQQRRTGSRYGSFAYGTVVLACYSQYFTARNFYWSEWMVPVTFALGALYVALGILGGAFTEAGRTASRLGLYYVVQCAILTAILALSPLRGFLGILVLPLMAQAIFDLRPRHAAVVGVYLFAANVAIWGIPYGWDAALEATISYATAFVFTAVFTYITRQALLARRAEQKLREEMEEANRRLREHAAQAEELATARERNRVAREIHDGVGHYLTVVKTQLDAASALFAIQPERAREAVAKAAKLAGDALDDVRRSVGSLRADLPRQPLPEMLRRLAGDAGLPVEVRVEGMERQLAPAVEHALFRSAQEGLTNVRKHSGASTAELVLDFRKGGRVLLEVSDDGRGTNGINGEATGFGLVGVRERIEVLGGRVDSGNRGGGGFALTVEVPA